jgi:RNA polymerase sigma-70 factor (ECF subfamily)
MADKCLQMSPDEKMVTLREKPRGNDNIFDDAAFEIFFKKHFTPLCAYCQYKFGFELEMSKDAVHSAFLKLWEARELISAELSLKAYLYKTVANICLDMIKHQKVAYTKEKQLVELNRPDELNNGFEQADFKQLGADIEHAISELPEQMRKVFLLCRYEGLKYAEVANQLSISVKTVETQMSRALAKLRQKLSDYLLLIFIFIYLTF